MNKTADPHHCTAYLLFSGSRKNSGISKHISVPLWSSKRPFLMICSPSYKVSSELSTSGAAGLVWSPSPSHLAASSCWALTNIDHHQYQWQLRSVAISLAYLLNFLQWLLYQEQSLVINDGHVGSKIHFIIPCPRYSCVLINININLIDIPSVLLENWSKNFTDGFGLLGLRKMMLEFYIQFLHGHKHSVAMSF